MVRNACVVLVSLAACLPAYAVQRAFVASSGSDANAASSCTFVNPCRTFAGAQPVVDPGGEIVTLDAAGYGPVTITKSISLVGNPGFFAGIAASAGNAVTIATAGINVTLRGLSINGVGGTHGVSVTAANRVSIENCVISNFTTNGVVVDSATEVRITDSLVRDNQRGVLLKGGAEAIIANTKILGNSVAGLMVNSGLASATTVATVSDAVLSGNDINVYAFETVPSALSRIAVNRSTISYGTFGVKSEFAGGPTVIAIAGSQVIANSTGFAQAGAGATLESLGNNSVRMNGPDSGTVTSIALR
jgi:hypothetical protein